MEDLIYRDDPKPWPHQLEALELSWRRPAFALLMEQRTGKTRVAIDTAVNLFRNGSIEAVLIIAPNGVHRNWLEEFPRYGSPEIMLNCRTCLWESSKMKRADKRDDLAILLERPPTSKYIRSGLRILAMNVEALRLDRAFTVAGEFVRRFKVLAVVDESQTIATPGAKQTKRARTLGKYASYRRILTGTPATESPFQLYSQFAFLDPKILGFQTYASFKQRYGEFSEGWNRGQGRSFPQLEGYRNVEELQKKIAPFSFRFRRDQFSDEVPEKIYQKAYVQLTPVQRRAYDEIRDAAATELADGRSVTAAEVLTRYLRLQQVTSNYWPATTELLVHDLCDGNGCADCSFLGVVEKEFKASPIDPDLNPRLDALERLIAEELESGGKVIVWARFRNDVSDVISRLRSGDVCAVRYDGEVNSAARRASLDAFKNGAGEVFVASPAAAGRGINLSEATMMIYYSNAYSLEQRLQSEDRAEALGRKHHTQIIDLVAEDTIDEVVISALRDKRSLAAEIAGDPQKRWL